MKIVSTFLGLSIGDALGVPVEFRSRERIAQNPVTTMRGFGTHQQPIGTWSDDSSLAFCLAESLCKGYDLGSDTDTTGCVTDGLAGLYYGLEAIPKDWIAVLVKKDAIIRLANRLEKALQHP
ncbi:MAG: hypothetical protein RIS64_4135, partial [Bacteroidota bacterium]|jgi:ADP-ribosylglycohydrolase